MKLQKDEGALASNKPNFEWTLWKSFFLKISCAHLNYYVLLGAVVSKQKDTKIGLREKLQRVPVLQMSNQESCVTNFFKEKNKDPWNVFVCGSSLQSI